ncbi:TPA: S-adenosyl-l-methionine hydroxide adenosyltransferase family protein [Aeromonas salmonicida subsp. salmonicida]|uniref:SAM hydrolase/SAM-dependent halogenase family protein n=1 Tax=Aeromonas salmonicida TaxID=645 RepID=UPI00131F8F29|nr:S-adenosyl-l-methionine hydroxide adenosyltransferase family protein [Aeromonas salmonicida]ELI6420139.1 S-adenosyl-l-methionine hydroxide adenosyltransferase family protein [Aeromonas salmonicida subsp. salmonicida]ELM3648526.1 S-adenosyl-l-methionine hydroxide adenosyltransferase family protein [Aeromonas salmonicida subsp. salmonicida]QHE44670.1 DNA-directed RNA polymerase subunit delta [Aeromonas salmonicida subsp. salmonicida]QHE46466.1 DNA-directed RNA polymerase subunit delta [Aeromon
MDIRTAPRALALALLLASGIAAANEALVIQTDFGLKDGAVSAMKGVAFGVDRTLPLYDLTHEIPAYNIWEGAYRLYQTLQYWPKGSVFVSVVDPGVGTDRHSVVLKTRSGHYIVTPDNGTLTLVAEHFGIDAVRQIDEKTNRLKGSEKSYTFHGRDVYAYTGARLASSAISYEQVGPLLPADVVKIPYQPAVAEKDGTLKGTIPILDVQYGNVWTNIDETLLTQVGINKGDKACIKISEGDVVRYDGKAPYVSSFGDVLEGQPLVYLNSLLQVSVALNMDSFAAKHQVQSGANWHISLKKCS